MTSNFNLVRRRLAKATRLLISTTPTAIREANTILSQRIALNASGLPGKLAQSVKVEPISKAGLVIRGAVSVDDPRAKLVEFGSVRNLAQPYYRPAITSERPAMANHINKTLHESVER